MSSPTITEEFEGFIKGITRPKLLPNIQTRTLQVNYGEDSFELDLFSLPVSFIQKNLFVC